jgi:Rrf2 family transcriptional regulator, iron-sulfur cluster assembly transcription factor
MLHVTRKGDYAIRGMVYLAGRPEGEFSLLGDIAAGVDVPKALLAKIFQQFNKVGLVSSVRGAGGGFTLRRPAEQISLLEIIEDVEGPILLNRCLLAEGACGRDSICTVHPVWREVQESMRSVLGGVSLRHLAAKGVRPGHKRAGRPAPRRPRE